MNLSIKISDVALVAIAVAFWVYVLWGANLLE